MLVLDVVSSNPCWFNVDMALHYTNTREYMRYYYVAPSYCQGSNLGQIHNLFENPPPNRCLYDCCDKASVCDLGRSHTAAQNQKTVYAYL